MLVYYPVAAFLVPNLQFKSKALDVKYESTYVVAVFQVSREHLSDVWWMVCFVSRSYVL